MSVDIFGWCCWVLPQFIYEYLKNSKRNLCNNTITMSKQSLQFIAKLSDSVAKGSVQNFQKHFNAIKCVEMHWIIHILHTTNYLMSESHMAHNIASRRSYGKSGNESRTKEAVEYSVFIYLFWSTKYIFISVLVG